MSKIDNELIKAAENGNVKKIQQVLESNNEGNRVAINFSPALRVAAQNGNLSCVKELVGLTALEERGDALMVAVDRNHTACFKFLSPLCTRDANADVLYKTLRFSHDLGYVEVAFKNSGDPRRTLMMVGHAMEFNKPYLVDIMVKHQSPNDTLDILYKFMKNHPANTRFYEYFENEISSKQKSLLHSTLNITKTTTNHRKI